MPRDWIVTVDGEVPWAIVVPGGFQDFASRVGLVWLVIRHSFTLYNFSSSIVIFEEMF